MILTRQEVKILRKRKFRRFVKFMFGLIFRSITYFLIFARHRDENMNAVGGVWYPTKREVTLVARIKADKKAEKSKKAEKKQKIKDSKKTVAIA